MSKLDPCPLCGSEPDLNVGHQESWVICRPCGLAVDVGATSGSAAINAWNDVTANFTQPIKTLRDALETMVEMVEMNGFGRNYAMGVARAALAQDQVGIEND